MLEPVVNNVEALPEKITGQMQITLTSDKMHEEFETRLKKVPEAVKPTRRNRFSRRSVPAGHHVPERSRSGSE